jgi:hypothetical protein
MDRDDVPPIEREEGTATVECPERDRDKANQEEEDPGER